VAVLCDAAVLPLAAELSAVAEVRADSSATATDAQSVAAIQNVFLIIPSLQTGETEHAVNADLQNHVGGGNSGKLARVCGAFMGRDP